MDQNILKFAVEYLISAAREYEKKQGAYSTNHQLQYNDKKEEKPKRNLKPNTNFLRTTIKNSTSHNRRLDKETANLIAQKDISYSVYVANKNKHNNVTKTLPNIEWNDNRHKKNNDRLVIEISDDSDDDYVKRTTNNISIEITSSDGETSSTTPNLDRGMNYIKRKKKIPIIKPKLYIHK